MSIVFAIIVYIASQVVPPGVASFQVVAANAAMANGQPQDKIIEFTRQVDGTWRAVELPRNQYGTYAVSGTVLTVTLPEDKKQPGNAKPHTLDLAQYFDLGEHPDWATLTEFAPKPGGKVTLTRQPGQVTVNIVVGTKADAQPQVFHIRWQEPKQP